MVALLVPISCHYLMYQLKMRMTWVRLVSMMMFHSTVVKDNHLLTGVVEDALGVEDVVVAVVDDEDEVNEDDGEGSNSTLSRLLQLAS